MIGVTRMAWATRATLAVAFLSVLLAACSGNSDTSQSCPGVLIMPELNSIAFFPPGAEHKVQNVQLGGKMIATLRSCEVAKGSVAVNVTVQFTVARSSLEIRRIDLTYIVAVVDINRTILNEQRFTLPVVFTANENFRPAVDKVTVHLPVKSVAAAGAYGILVGFQLTPEQLEFNRMLQQQPQ